MRRVIAIIAVVFFFGCADAQKMKEGEVPETVVSAFHKGYPDVKEYTWYNENVNYEAEYEVGEMEAAVVFNPKGEVVETEIEIQVEKLPAAVAEYVSKNYSGARIKEASEITDSGGMKTFEAEIKGKDLVFDVNGNFLKEEKG